MTVNKTANLILIPSVQQKEDISHLEKFSDIREEYSKKLNNPNFTQKDISPLKPKTEVEQRDLNVIAVSFDRNNELKGLLDSALIGSYCRSNKFQPWRLPVV